MRILVTTIAAFFMISTQVSAVEYRIPVKEIQNKASESLSVFNKLVTKRENYREMGFESPKELEKLRLGVPLQLFTVRLDKLKEYQKGSDPAKIIGGGNHVIYPVSVNNQVRSSITLAEVEGGWEAVSFGNPALVKLLEETRMKSTGTTRLPLSSYFVVRVPALNFYFLGYRLNNGLMLTPLLDDPRYHFKKGVSLPADEVFTALLPAAKEHDGLPR